MFHPYIKLLIILQAEALAELFSLDRRELLASLRRVAWEKVDELIAEAAREFVTDRSRPARARHDLAWSPTFMHWPHTAAAADPRRSGLPRPRGAD